ncbi:MAG: hypothetical protein V4598_10765 [Bdellovibrionota bacterium]
MAKKKPAAKMQKKKPVQSAGKKSPSKKVAKMAKKAPAKKAPAKKSAPAKKPAKGIVSKVVAKVKAMTKEQLKALKAKEMAAAAKEKAQLAKERAKEKAAEEKEKARDKALLAKEKERELKEKSKSKEKEKEQKEKAKLAAVQAKIQAKEDEKRKKIEDKQRAKDQKEREKRIARGEEVEDEAPRRRNDEEEGEDEFLEYAKKSKGGKATKSKYDEEVQVDLFEGKSKKYKNQVMNDLEGKIADEIAELREHFNWKDIAEAIGTMDFFIDPKNDECIEKGCDNIRTTQSYCRLHYLRNWKVVQKKRDILKEGKLQEYIEELLSKYPTKYIEALLSDLSDDKDFYTVLNQLNITSEFDFEEDEFENAVDDDDDGDDIGIETISSSLRYEDE